ncbi:CYSTATHIONINE BETA-SYNTHASE (CBS) FAMILY PROTEIN [Salix koriyanagi]|uniref:CYSTATHIONINE BETA-SYNTHASE (CBS) FAMILY PROTEIN n=1 Tax=Salix koriyanagi TaxID=2511006 RepID=A0A9Q0QLE4_9ROSI|nr:CYSTATHIONINE BETA-SYNTHASE (CBS) FAMILY PROTEIN [Salix koriyanagi]
MAKRFQQCMQPLGLLAANSAIVPCPPEKQPTKQGKRSGKYSFLPHPIIQEKNLARSRVFSLKNDNYGLNPSHNLTVTRSPNSAEMQVQGVRACQETLRVAILRRPHVSDTIERRKILPHFGRVTSTPPVGEKEQENLTVADVLMIKGEEKVGSWLWCRTTDTVYDAVKNVGL